mgnify:CR=1 FL=1
MSKPHITFRRWARPAAVTVALSAVLLLSACASNKIAPPTDDMALARASITRAEAAGAGQLAPVELLSAREKLVRAETALRSEQFDQARFLAEESAADAELAERKARADRARRAAEELKRSNATLQQEVGGRPGK